MAEWRQANPGKQTEEVPVPPFLRELGWAGADKLTHKVADPAALPEKLFTYWKTKGFDMGQSNDELNELRLIFE